MSLQQDAIAAGMELLLATAGREVTVRRGNLSAALVVAVGKSEYASQAATGLVEEIETRDYLLRAADYDFGGGPALPQRGDVLEDRISGQTTTWEVAPPGAGQQHYRPMDPDHCWLRVHTHQVH